MLDISVIENSCVSKKSFGADAFADLTWNVYVLITSFIKGSFPCIHPVFGSMLNPGGIVPAVASNNSVSNPDWSNDASPAYML